MKKIRKIRKYSEYRRCIYCGYCGDSWTDSGECPICGEIN